MGHPVLLADVLLQYLFVIKLLSSLVDHRVYKDLQLFQIRSSRELYFQHPEYWLR